MDEDLPRNGVYYFEVGVRFLAVPLFGFLVTSFLPFLAIASPPSPVVAECESIVERWIVALSIAQVRAKEVKKLCGASRKKNEAVTVLSLLAP